MSQYFNTFFSTYLSELSDRESLDNALQLVYDAIHEHNLQETFTSVVFTGMSGALFGPLLAHKLDKFVCGVRKRGEKSHSDFKLEGRISNEFTICDDIISTGSSIDYVVKTVQKEVLTESKCFGIKPPWQAKLVGVILYGLGNSTEIIQNVCNDKNIWVLWQDKLYTPN